jgi:cell division protein FtsQ
MLGGPNPREVVAYYFELSELCKKSNHSMNVLMADNRRYWQIHLDNGIWLDMGRQDIQARMRRFLKVYPIIRRDGGNAIIERIDLRYSNGLVVKWATNTGPVPAQT